MQLWLAENWNFEPKYLSPIYVSLAATHADCKQYSLALQYYSKELQLQSGNAGEVRVSSSCHRGFQACIYEPVYTKPLNLVYIYGLSLYSKAPL